MSGSSTYADWIAVDWGTSNLRVWAMQDDQIRDKLTSDEGMGGLMRDQFEPVLLSHIEPWLGSGTTPVIACGMVGSRQGWAEAPYRTVPTTPVASSVAVTSQDKRIAARILPGLNQISHPDVMRGEETQIAGFLSVQPDFDGVLCLPGTHAKWCRISAGEIVSFQTFMTGELFKLLRSQSVLRHSTGDGSVWDETAFLEAVSDMISRPESLAAKLFQIRADDLLNGAPPAQGHARLSGLLLGSELAAARPYWLGQNVAIVGAPGLNRLYVSALKQQAVEAEPITGDEMTLKGLIAAFRSFTA